MQLLIEMVVYSFTQNNPMHARRRRRPRKWLNHARRPRDRWRYDPNPPPRNDPNPPPRNEPDARRRARKRTSSRGATNCGMATRRVVRGANVDPDGKEEPEPPFAVSTGVRVGRVNGSISVANVNSDGKQKRERPDSASTGVRWNAKTDTVAGPSESSLATRLDRSLRTPTSGWMASRTGLLAGHRVS